jgi:hypothetical protein
MGFGDKKNNNFELEVQDASYTTSKENLYLWPRSPV